MFCGAAVGEVKNSGTQVPSLLPGVFGVAYCVSLRVAALASGAGSGSSSSVVGASGLAAGGRSKSISLPFARGSGHFPHGSRRC